MLMFYIILYCIYISKYTLLSASDGFCVASLVDKNNCPFIFLVAYSASVLGTEGLSISRGK